EDGIAERLTERLDGAACDERVIVAEPLRKQVALPRLTDNSGPRPAALPAPSSPPNVVAPSHAPQLRRPERPGKKPSARAWLRRSPAVSASLVLHGTILLLCGSITYATLVQNPLPLVASASEPSELWDEETPPVEIETADVDSLVPDEIAIESDVEALTAEDLVAVDGMEVGGPLADAQEFGFSGLVTSDMGTLLAGPGGAGDGPGMGVRGRRAARFFDTEAEGNRIVFVVDNSASMKQGRMETTLLEILRSVEMLAADQFFYVIFYSDRAYPMFYPEPVERMLPATPQNKQRLQEWFGTVELCMGGKLVEAIELAATLNPQVVYVLSDGAIGGSRTMSELTAPSDWEFTIHTLGMTVRTPADAANLVAIAEAHGGTFQHVQPNPLAIQMARQRPIKQNKMGVTWGN
ncbi:MAG: hypothetical protein WEH44_01410, partial [Pirellulaceae bacterium]